MASKKSIEDLDRSIRDLESRLREKKKELGERTRAEEAKKNAEIVKAIRAWQEALPEEDRTPWGDLPERFRRAGEAGEILRRKSDGIISSDEEDAFEDESDNVSSYEDYMPAERTSKIYPRRSSEREAV